ncbi:MAG: YfhO family protein [Eubacteriales bacterium]
MNFNNKLKSNFYYILSFLIPGLILLLVLFTFGIYPFGKKSLLILDMYNQYVDYFACLRNIVLGDRSFLYSWGKTLGGNFIGFYSYYLSSPLSFLTLLFPEKNLTEAILTLTVLKVSLSGLTFSILLNFLFKKNDLTLVIFSSFYALMSFSVLYAQNIMWLDSLIWLPIIIIGVEKIIIGEKPIIYIISLSIMFISCYYLSYSIGIFTVIYLIYRVFQSKIFDYKKIGKTFITFTWGTLLSIGLSSWLLLPTIYALKQGKISGAYILPALEVKFNFYEMASRLFVGSYENINNLGMPNIYCGIFITVLAILFFLNVAIDKRDKILSGIVLAIFILSMTLNIPDIAWHGFQSPNWFPSRYSFMFCFFLILIAYKSWLNIHFIKVSNIIGTIAITFILAFIIQQLNYKYLPIESIIVTYILLGSYIACLSRLSINIDLKKYIIIILLFLTIGELYYNTNVMINGLDTQIGFKDRSVYTNFRDKMLPIIDKIQNQDKSFYRMEMNFYRSRNEAIAFGYKGVTNYTSIYQQSVNNFCGQIGLAKENTRTIYNGATLWADSLLGIKYIMSKEPINGYYNPIYVKNDVTVYENPFALNLGFMIDSNSISQSYESLNPYSNQEKLILDMSKTKAPCFTNVENVKVTSSNLVYTQVGDKLNFTKRKLQDPGVVYYTFPAPQNGPIYAFITSDVDEGCKLYVNNVFITNIFDSEKNCSVFLGDFKNGEIVQAKFIQNMKTKIVNRTYFASLNILNLKNSIEILKQSEFRITNYSDTHIEGSVQVKDKNLFFTSIPFDKGWTIKVDGIKIEPQIFDKTFICFSLKTGLHRISMDYISEGLVPGFIISLFCFFLIILIMNFERIRKYFSIIKSKQ